jgi:hypothetical protein
MLQYIGYNNKYDAVIYRELYSGRWEWYGNKDAWFKSEYSYPPHVDGYYILMEFYG